MRYEDAEKDGDKYERCAHVDGPCCVVARTRSVTGLRHAARVEALHEADERRLEVGATTR